MIQQNWQFSRRPSVFFPSCYTITWCFTLCCNSEVIPTLSMVLVIILTPSHSVSSRQSYLTPSNIDSLTDGIGTWQYFCVKFSDCNVVTTKYKWHSHGVTARPTLACVTTLARCLQLQPGTSWTASTHDKFGNPAEVIVLLHRYN